MDDVRMRFVITWPREWNLFLQNKLFFEVKDFRRKSMQVGACGFIYIKYGKWQS